MVSELVAYQTFKENSSCRLLAQYNNNCTPLNQNIRDSITQRTMYSCGVIQNFYNRFSSFDAYNRLQTYSNRSKQTNWNNVTMLLDLVNYEFIKAIDDSKHVVG